MSADIEGNMKDIKEICVEEGTTVSDGIRRLDAKGKKILLVTKRGRLTGVVTDGDVRRWILNKGDFDTDICELMYRKPRTVRNTEREKAKDLMIQERLEAIPVLNEREEPVDIIFMRDMLVEPVKKFGQVDIPVVIMAGGKGTRLNPYTNVLPKPLIPIGSETILERIIDSFRKNGCNSFWLTLNYKKNLIKAYFDEKKHAYDLSYVEEETYLGTCGSLHLLRENIKDTFFLSNCDVLLDIDYAKLYEFHKKNGYELTAVTSLKHFQIPYGVFELEMGGQIAAISEKPEYNFQVNTGVYVIEASVLKDIPKEEVFQMTNLINLLLEQKRKVGAYPVTDRAWKDMGEIAQMQKMIHSFR